VKRGALKAIDSTEIDRARQIIKDSFARAEWTREEAWERSRAIERDITQDMGLDLDELRAAGISDFDAYLEEQLNERLNKDDIYFFLLIAANFIERGLPVPQTLRKMVAAELRNHRAPFGIFKSAKNDKLWRDQAIANAISEVVGKTGLLPTRNRARRTKENPSACSLVAEWLGRPGHRLLIISPAGRERTVTKPHISEDLVEKIWSGSVKNRKRWRDEIRRKK
jgi:hypothetical protein